MKNKNKIQKDYLSRKPYLELLKSIIKNQKNNKSGYSFAINGEWGCGKTWLLSELQEHLIKDKKNKYLIFYYNAWENDFYAEPLIALISVMVEKINSVISQKSLYESVINELTKEALRDLRLLVTSIIKEVTKIDIEQSIESKKKLIKRIKNGRKIENNIDKFIPLKKMIDIVRKSLIQLSNNYYLIIIVDELDRCLPEYAIKVLERLHHVCNDLKLIQILAIDKKNLSDSIANVFGKDYSDKQDIFAWNEHFADKYLQKFVDIIIPLPNGKPDDNLDVLNGLNKNYYPFIRGTGRGEICLDNKYLSEFISKLMNGIDRRLQEKIFKQVALCHKLTCENQRDFDKKHLTYAVLIYEIISCISHYVFHFNDICEVQKNNSFYKIEFYSENTTVDNLRPNEIGNHIFNHNIKNLFITRVQYSENSNHEIIPYLITNTLTYIMAFFYKPVITDFDYFQKGLWIDINYDKKFLNKYDEIMKILLTK